MNDFEVFSIDFNERNATGELIWHEQEDDMKDKDIKLKKCPFCGGSASFEERHYGFIVRCDNRFLPNPTNKLCGVNGRTRRDATTRELAANYWNTRNGGLHGRI